MIVKDELHNLPRLFQSFHGCVDKLYITDTGSTDGTIEYIHSSKAKEDLGCDIKVFNFVWVKDFSLARNHNLEFIEEDYWMWVDGDDSLGNKENFMAWKRSTMHLADAFVVPYQYAMDENRNPIISFARERVFKTKIGAFFKDFIHEGVYLDMDKTVINGVDSWRIIHERTTAEMMADRGRNLEILKQNEKTLSPRLKFYYGKEYFDNGDMINAAIWLLEALKELDLGLGDRILGIQYLVNSLVNQQKWSDALKYSFIGLNLDPIRAEFHCFVGDVYCAINEPHKAVPFYQAALGCVNRGNGMTHEFFVKECYGLHPILNLSKIYFNQGDFDKAYGYASQIEHPEASEIIKRCFEAKSNLDISKAMECDDIVITCPMQKAYPWDEEVYKTKGLGGSETAAVEMAKHLKSLTGRSVKIFQDREETFVAESGVEYISNKHLHSYFKKWKPALHIAWRHNIKMTNAPTYVWCHDLTFEALRDVSKYDKVMALSPFHKDFLRSTCGIPEDKIMLTRNGIEPKRFEGLEIKKEALKVIWPNSPDRGLEIAIKILEIVRSKHNLPVTLDVYYGIENLRKFGQAAKAEMLEKMISERPWIKYHGNVDQVTLAHAFARSEVWLYPASFIETFCLSAVESILCKCYPVVRDIGALPDTLRKFSSSGMADVLDLEVDDSSLDTWAKAVADALEFKKYQDIEADADSLSWFNLAKEWVNIFKL